MKQSVIRTEKMNLKRKREATTAPQLHILELQTALLTGNTALAGNNQACHFVRYTFLYNGQIGTTSTYRPDIFLRSLGAKPMNRIFLLAERPAHLGEVHPNTGTVTLERYHVTVNARELYQTVYIFHRTRNTKKEKPP